MTYGPAFWLSVAWLVAGGVLLLYLAVRRTDRDFWIGAAAAVGVAGAVFATAFAVGTVWRVLA